MPMDTLTLLIEDMDCPDEVIILKRELLPLVGDQSRLVFDILSRRLKVDLTGIPMDKDRIIAAVSATGMRAVPQADALEGCACCGGVCSAAAQATFWSRRGRVLLCAASGSLWLAGLAAAAIAHGSLSRALLEHESIPLVAAAFWLAAAFSGMWHVLPKAAHSLRTLRPDMNLLMVVAAAGAVALGDYSEAGSVAFLFALANQLESWSVGRARRSVQALVDITPATALVLEPLMPQPVQRRVKDVPVGTMVLARPGDRIALDGVVRKGSSAVDQSPITGESSPVPKAPGDQVFAGTVNTDGALEFETTQLSSDTTLARIMHMVEAAQSRRAKAVRWVEKFAAVYTPAMVGVSALVALVPPLALGGGFAEWFYQALVVLVISCPCALVISTPVSVVAGLASAARNGVLVKGGAFLEAPASISAVALDKTGTLTRGKPSVVSVSPAPGAPENELLAIAASLESRSSHPLAQAILEHGLSRGAVLPEVDDAQAHPGRGAQGRIGGHLYFAGNERLLHEKAPGLLTDGLAGELARAAGAGVTTVVVWNESKVLGTLSLKDEPRPQAREAVEELKRLGIGRVVMLTGDNEQTARAIAARTGVTEFKAGLLPEDKIAVVAEMARTSGHVAMVGDGVNDAPALAASNLGVAMGSVGTAVAVETADVALMSDDLLKLPWLIRHSRRVLSTIKANIAFALGLKVVFLGLACLKMATLWTAILADMGASLIVIFNGLRLLRIRK